MGNQYLLSTTVNKNFYNVEPYHTSKRSLRISPKRVTADEFTSDCSCFSNRFQSLPILLMKKRSILILIPFFLTGLITLSAESRRSEIDVRKLDIGLGWAQNSVNTPIFRKNSVISDEQFQFVSYYDEEGYVVVAKRELTSNDWNVERTAFKGNVKDAHNSISLMLDGEGYLHLSWDHHNSPLKYTRSTQAHGLEFPEESPSMIGSNEKVVSYPEFYRFPDGDLLFAYREGGSGNGNLLLNRYDLESQTWSRIQTNLIDGQGLRNAYWQLCIDTNDTIHLSWVWRESPNVSSNHDMSYAKSIDGGVSWQKSDGSSYSLPINIENAEVIHIIPQGSNLINQTSITADSNGQPYIATYYRETEDAATQYHLFYYRNNEWFHSIATDRALESDFELEGIGSRSIPISRPQLLVNDTTPGQTQLYLIYRDEAHQNQVCLTQTNLDSLDWSTEVLYPEDMGRWEPSYDTYRWQTDKQLHLFLQSVGQGQAETLESIPPQKVSILECEL